jgi:cyanate permease
MGAISTLGLFRIPYYIEQGVSAQAVAFALSFEAVVAAIAGLGTGWLVDRFPARFISAVSTIPMILAFVFTVGADSVWQVFFAAGMFGIAAQSFAISQGTLWPSYFGSENIGKIRGIALPLGLVLSAISAPATGAIKDSTGSFMIAWVIACFALSACTLLLLATPKPKHPGGGAPSPQHADEAPHLAEPSLRPRVTDKTDAPVP